MPVAVACSSDFRVASQNLFPSPTTLHDKAVLPNFGGYALFIFVLRFLCFEHMAACYYFFVFQVHTVPNLAYTDFRLSAVVADEIKKTNNGLELIRPQNMRKYFFYVSVVKMLREKKKTIARLCPVRVSRRFPKSTSALFCVSLKRRQHLPIISAHNYENYSDGITSQVL